MDIKISFKHLEHTEALDQRIQEKSQHFSKYLNGKVDLQWICWVDDKGKHWAELKLLGPKINFFASSCEDSIYKCLDQVVSKVEKQIAKKKNKMRDRIHGHEPSKMIYLKEIEKDEQKAYDESLDQEAI